MKNIYKPFKKLFIKLLEKFINSKELNPNVIDDERIKKILVIRQHDQLGDFLLSTPVYRALREKYPHAKISVLVRDYFVEVAKLVPYVDDVLVFYGSLTKWTYKNLRVFYSKLRDKWDITIVLNTVSHSLSSDLLAYFSNSTFILGSSGMVFPGCKKNFFYNLLSPVDSVPKHQTEINLDIIRYIGVDTNDLSEKINVNCKSVETVKKEIMQRSNFKYGVIVGFHVGAGKVENRWPLTYFAELGHNITDNYKAQIILFWGPKEKELKNQLDSLFPSTIKVYNVGLDKLVSYIAVCDVVVCNDTGIMHLASAIGVKVIALFGPTDPKEWKPQNKNCVAIRAKSQKVKDINVSEVMVELERMLFT